MTQYAYDAGGRLVQVTYADQTQDLFTDDPNGNRTSSTSHGRLATTYTYDPLNRVVQQQLVGVPATRTVYDALGRVSGSSDQLGNTTTYQYDDAGRRIAVIDALTNKTSFRYDAAGNQTGVTDANQHATQYVYDDAGRRTQTIFPDQSTEAIAYDQLGRQLSRTDQAGNVTQFGYDPLGRLTSVTQSPDGTTLLVTSYGYDELGNRITQTDANGHTTSYAYDQLGRRTSRTLPLGMSEGYLYDSAGNMTSKTDFNGHTTGYKYNPMNRLTQKTADPFFSTGACAPVAGNSFPCGATQVSYTYTATGKRASMTDASGTWGYSYDNADRLTFKINDPTEISWSYDAAGNLLGISTNGQTGVMSYSYDPLNRLQTVTGSSFSDSMKADYSYDPVGNLSGVRAEGVMNTSYQLGLSSRGGRSRPSRRNPLNRLTGMQTVCDSSATGCTPSQPLAGYGYTLGPAGNRLSVTELSGRTVSYTYDDLYRLTSETIAGATTQNGAVSYQYDPVGNRKQLSSTVPAIPATGLLNYDANDRTSTQPYDAEGNLLSSGAGNNVYDFENRLVQAGGVQLVYDGDGNRVQETVAGIKTLYEVAEVNPTGYAQVIEERGNAPGGVQVIRDYVYGLELLRAPTLEQQQVGFNLANTVTSPFYGIACPRGETTLAVEPKEPRPRPLPDHRNGHGHRYVRRSLSSR